MSRHIFAYLASLIFISCGHDAGQMGSVRFSSKANRAPADEGSKKDRPGANNKEALKNSSSTESLVDKNLPWVTEQVKSPGVVFRTFQSKITQGKVSYHIYIPESYHKSATKFPVLYWLHGTQGGVLGISKVSKFFDDEMAKGHVPEMLIVFVNGLPRRLWADSKDGASPVERVFVNDVISDVENEFRVLPERRGRILEGFCMGGYGAARIGFKYPDLFSGISILAGGPLDTSFEGPKAKRNQKLRQAILNDVCSNDMDYFKAISPWMIAENSKKDLTEKKNLIRQVVGTLDETAELNRRFHEHLSSLKISHDYIEVPNIGHDAEALLEKLGRKNGEFYRKALEQKP